MAEEDGSVPMAKEDGSVPAEKWEDSSATNTPNASWEVIKNREKQRVALFNYEESTSYHIALKFRYTILDYILKDRMFYFTIGVYVVVRVIDYLYEEYIERLDGDHVFPKGGSFSVIGTFMSFTLTFFVNQAVSGYNHAYNLCMGAKGKITEFAQKGGTVLPKERVTRIVRHLNAAHLVGYAGLTQHTNKDNFIMPLNKEMNLLTKDEMAKLNDLKNVKGTRYCFQIVMWIMKDIKQAAEMKEVDEFTASELMNLAQAFRKSMSAHFNASNIPTISFFYFHLISFLCVIYLPIFAMHEALAVSDPPDIGTGPSFADFVQVVVVIVQCFYVIGMRILAVKLMNPYGEDVENLALVTFIRAAWNSSNQTLRIVEDEEELMADPVAWNKKDRPSLLMYAVENKIG